MKAEVHNEHQWLKQLLGKWTFSGKALMGPDQPPQRFEGDESVRALGDVWVLCEGQGHMPGVGPATTMMTLGFDPKKQRFVGTWIGSIMSYLIVYDGEVDLERKVLSLYAEGADFADENKTCCYRDVIQLQNENQRSLTSFLQGEDGQWHQFMIANYQRVGSV